MSIDPSQVKVDASQWGGFLEQAAREPGRLGGRQYIYLNASGEAGITSPSLTLNLARREVYPANIATFKQLVEITRHILQNCNSTIGAQLEGSIRSMADRMVKEADPSVDAPSLEIAKEILFPSFAHLSLIQSAEIRSVTTNAVIVNRSDKGKDGVYFIDATISNEIKRVVVKAVVNPANVLVADALFRVMGLSVPKSIAVSQNAPEGSLIKAKLETLVKDAFKDELSNHLETKDHFLYTEFVEGSSFGSLTLEERVQLANPVFMRQLGKMVFIDTLCGNNDRLSTKNLNPHNFMIASGKLVCIDNTFNSTPEEPTARKTRLTDMLSNGTNEPKSIRDLFRKLTTEPLRGTFEKSLRETFSDVDFARYNYPGKCGNKKDNEIREEIIEDSKINGHEADFISPSSIDARAALRQGIRDAAKEFLTKSEESDELFNLIPQEAKSEFREIITIIKQMGE